MAVRKLTIRRRTILCMMMLACAAIMVAISPMLEQFQREYGLTTIQQGTLLMFQFMGFTIFTLVGGIGADYFSKKAMLILSLSMVPAALLILTFIHNFFVLLLGLFLIGGGLGILESLTVSMMSDIAQGDAALHINILQAFFGIGALAFPILMAYVLGAGYSWKLLYQISAIFYLLLLVFFWKTPYQENREKTAFCLEDVRNLGKNGPFLVVCLCMFCYTGAEVGVWGWITTYMKNVIGFSDLASNVCLGLFWGMVVVGRLAVGFLSQRFPTSKIILFLSGISVVVTLGIAVATLEEMIWFSVFAMGLSYSAQWPTLVAYGSQLCDRSSGVVFAVLTAAGGVGMTVVPYVMGIISQYTNERISMLLPVVLLLVIPIAIHTISKRSNERAGR